MSWSSGHGTASGANPVSSYTGTSGKARKLWKVGREGGQMSCKASAGFYHSGKQEAKSSAGNKHKGRFSEGIVGILVLNSQLA